MISSRNGDLSPKYGNMFVSNFVLFVFTSFAKMIRSDRRTVNILTLVLTLNQSRVRTPTLVSNIFRGNSGFQN